MDMLIKASLLFLFFAVMVVIGFACRRHARNVDGFVLGGRSVGPWLTHLGDVGRHRQRAHRLAPRVGGAGAPHAHHDAAP